MNLFIDTSNKFLIFLLEKDDVIIDSYSCIGERRFSDITVSKLIEFFKKNNITWNNIKSIYTTMGPGSYTGSRIGLTIAKTIKIIKNEVTVYVISSLLFQVGNSTSYSYLSANNNHFYFAKFADAKLLGEIKMIKKNNLVKNKQMIIDYENINYSSRFIELKTKFVKIKNINSFKIPYFKMY